MLPISKSTLLIAGTAAGVVAGSAGLFWGIRSLRQRRKAAQFAYRTSKSTKPTTSIQAAPPEVRHEERDTALSATSVIGNQRTRVYHSNQEIGVLPAEENRVYFDSEADAIAAGYQRAGNEPAK